MDDDVAAPERARAAQEMLVAHGSALRRNALRVSLCEADAEDALQRSLEILLTKAPSVEPRRLAAWMSVVTRHEALALRRSREREFGPARPDREEHEAQDPLELLAWDGPGPAERLIRSERVAEALEALTGLKASERTAIILQAQGHSYEEIRKICGWSYTKVNRCLAEGRAALRC